MSKIIKGKLNKKGPYPNTWKLFYQSSKGGLKPAPFWPESFSPGIRKAADGMLDVQFVWRERKADRIRLLSEDESVFEQAIHEAKSATEAVSTANMHCTPAAYRRTENKDVQRNFHNPYNFVPAIPPKKDGPLGQKKPVGHHKYHAEHWNGRIDIEIETVTPLLIPDAANERELDNGHKIFPVRVDADGRPLLAPTSVKGMLRSAYEAITNSRFGVFMGHDEPLAHRMNAGDGLAMIPARIVSDDEFELLMDTTSGKPIWQNGRWRAPDPMYAAWLPRYDRRGGVARWAVKYRDGSLPQHGDEVWCWLEKIKKLGRNDQPIFTYWRVRSIARTRDELPADPPRASEERSNHRPTGEEMIRVKGWVCVTNQNFSRKHDERVFFHDGSPPREKLTPEFKRDWKHLIRNYKELHEDKLKKRRQKGQRCDQFLGPNPDQTAFSRHVCEQDAENLKPGDLAYARVNEKGEIIGLYPVMIARELAKVAPEELLPEKLRPAQALEELSPADRVFGWVNQNGKGAWRGGLRIGPVRCETDDAIEDFGEDGLPLAILSTPKPQQARFYVGKNKCGGAQDDLISKEAAAYAENKGLRGRKVYPHPALVTGNDTYWNGQEAKDESGGREARQLQANGKTVYREYIRRIGEHGNRDDQNRSVRGWVKLGTMFSTWLEVENLNEAELGALLWLLELPDGHFLRLGGGKPLGFGSVQVRIKGLELVSGKGRKKQFESLMPVSLEDDEYITEKGKAEERFVAAYRGALEEAYDDKFEAIPFIDAFLKAAKGFADKPTHYPRRRAQPDPDGKNYEWFVRNEKEGHDIVEWKLALPNLMDEKGLPYVPDDEEQGGGRGGHRQGRRGHGGGRGFRR